MSSPKITSMLGLAVAAAAQTAVFAASANPSANSASDAMPARDWNK
jgi:hypothetical protein